MSAGIGESRRLHCFPDAAAPPKSSTLSLHDALPISDAGGCSHARPGCRAVPRSRCRGSRNPHGRKSIHGTGYVRSEEHTSELQSLTNLVCRLLLEKKNRDVGMPNAVAAFVTPDQSSP